MKISPLKDKLLAGFVGMSFLISLTLVGIYLIFTNLFFCKSSGCISTIWTGMFLIAAGLLIFIITIFGRYDTRYYIKQ